MPLPVALGALLVGLVFATTAEGYIYVANGGFGIARASNDGSNLDPDFIPPGGPGFFACGVAVNSTHIYWADIGGDIGRASIGGGNVERSFIDLPAGSSPCGVAVDAGHIYWASQGVTGIGRANIGGGSPNPSFVTTAGPTCGVAVDSGYVYFTYRTTPATIPSRAPLASPTAESIPVNDAAQCAIGVDSENVYWGEFPGGTTLGRAASNPIGLPNPSFIAPVSQPCSITTGGSHIYWTNYFLESADSGTVGRAALDAGGADNSFIAGLQEPCGIAVDSLPPPNTKITKARISSSRRTATFKFKAIGEASGFECQLKRKGVRAKPFKKCRSAKTYKKLARGRYRFSVRAVAPGATDPSPAKKGFAIR